MAWKKGDNGNLVCDDNGNPVWVNEAGEEKPCDYAALTKRLSEVNIESMKRKEKNRALEAKYAIFDGIEDLAAWKEEALKALEALKNAPEKDKELEAQITARIENATAGLKAQLAARDKTLAERDKLIAEKTAAWRDMAISADVKDSKILMERIRPEFRPLLLREMARAGDLDDKNLIFYKDSQGKPFYNGVDGEYASREQVPLLILKEMGIDTANVLLSNDGDTTGSGSKQSTNQHSSTPKSYAECKTMAEKMAFWEKDSNLMQNSKQGG